MPRNGSGTYSLPAGNPVTSGTVISSTVQNNTMSDMATALTQSLAVDGQSVPTANLPMAGFHHTNVGNATARTDYAAAGQVQDNAFSILGAVGGTGDAITASLAPAITAYTSGAKYLLTTTATNTMTTPTININGLGAKTIVTATGAALQAGDILSGATYELMYDGTNIRLLSSVAKGRLLNTQVFSTAGTATYTPTPGTNSVVVEVQGGGSGGGGVPVTPASNYAAGTGGAAGGYSKGRLTSGFSGVTVTVGAGGIGVSGSNGSNGGSSSFGAVITATGGTGGSSGVAITITVPGDIQAANSGVPGQGSGGNMITADGGLGGVGFYMTRPLGGYGGASHFGAGGLGRVNSASNGASAFTPGAGGGGCAAGNGAGAFAGGNGKSGIVIVWEYS